MAVRFVQCKERALAAPDERSRRTGNGGAAFTL